MTGNHLWPMLDPATTDLLMLTVLVLLALLVILGWLA